MNHWGHVFGKDVWWTLGFAIVIPLIIYSSVMPGLYLAKATPEVAWAVITLLAVAAVVIVASSKLSSKEKILLGMLCAAFVPCVLFVHSFALIALIFGEGM